MKNKQLINARKDKKKFDYEEARDLYTGDYKIIFEEIYQIMKEDQENIQTKIFKIFLFYH